MKFRSAHDDRRIPNGTEVWCRGTIIGGDARGYIVQFARIDGQDEAVVGSKFENDILVKDTHHEIYLSAAEFSIYHLLESEAHQKAYVKAIETLRGEKTL